LNIKDFLLLAIVSSAFYYFLVWMLNMGTWS